MEISETPNGIRVSTFLADMEMLTEEDMEIRPLPSEIEETSIRLARILQRKNRLPLDDNEDQTKLHLYV